MSIITWDNQLSVGIMDIDQQHKRLVGMVNQLHDAMGAGQGKQVLQQLLGSLITYTAVHFKAEEKLMQQHGYAGFAEHKRQHDELTAKVVSLQKRFESGQTMITLEVMNFLKDWLKGHILGSDKQYAAVLSKAMAPQPA